MFECALRKYHGCLPMSILEMGSKNGANCRKPCAPKAPINVHNVGGLGGNSVTKKLMCLKQFVILELSLLVLACA